MDATPWSAILGRRVTGPGGRSIRTVPPPQPRLIRLDELKKQEKNACLLAVRVLDVAEAEAWDVDGRENAVDVMLTLRDGRKAAFEITNLAGEGALHLAMRLSSVNHAWPAVGNWVWNVEVGSVDDLKRLEKCYAKIIRLCEQAGVPYPYEIAWEPSADADLQWLVHESSSEMTGFPELRVGDMQNPKTIVVPRAGGGWIDESLSGFAIALRDAFQKQHIKDHFDKLAKAGTDERHLFIPLHDSALPFGVSSELVFEDTLPPDPPPLPDSVTHLWLAPAGSRRVLLWNSADGWQNYPAK